MGSESRLDEDSSADVVHCGPLGTYAAAAAAAAAAHQHWPMLGECAYQSCYCEENVWLLAQTLLSWPGLQPSAELFAVFVSNQFKLVPLWCQRAAAHADAPVVWDYHVFILLRPGSDEPSLVFDLDCTLDPFPCTLADYRRHALLGSGVRLPAQYRRCYRVVPASLYLAHFASDRSHMRGSGGSWLQPPPSWPPLVGSAAAAAAGSCAAPPHTLPEYLSFPPFDVIIRDTEAAQGTADCLDDGQETVAHPAEPAWLGSLMGEDAFLSTFGGR